MLYNTFNFVFVFFPLVFLTTKLIKIKKNENTLYVFLTIASLYFYSFFFTKYLILILISILFNYSLGKILIKAKRTHKKIIFYFMIIFNLLLLVYFKYFNFILNNISVIFNYEITDHDIKLPLAISFFTFQQIAFLTSIYKKEIKEFKIIKYFLFISFFPQLIAGPIVKFSKFNSQLSKKNWPNILSKDNMAIGLFIFSVGMFKKIIISSYLASIADPIFANLNNNLITSTLDSWLALIAFSLQIYYDFSGYTDMAIGLGLFFGIKLPINFFSPYKATSIKKFWKRWHITLSNFLKTHIYIPLGGNRISNAKTNSNILITMLIGGFWHGASWNFILWGGYHALLIIIENFLKKIKVLRNLYVNNNILKLFIFFVITIGWVPFRCEDFESSVRMLKSLFFITNANLLFNITNYFNNLLLIIIILFFIFYFPNSTEIQNSLEKKIKNKNIKTSIYLSNVFMLAIIFLLLSSPSENINREFIYFQF